MPFTSPGHLGSAKRMRPGKVIKVLSHGDDREGSVQYFSIGKTAGSMTKPTEDLGVAVKARRILPSGTKLWGHFTSGSKK